MFIPAGLTCLNEVAAGKPRALFNSLTSCQAFRASHRLMKPGDPFSTETERNINIIPFALNICLVVAYEIIYTGKRKCRAYSVELSRSLMGIHAVPQGQLGNSSTVFTSEVIRDGLVVLSGVCEGLRYYKNKFTHKDISTTEMEVLVICLTK